MTVTARIMLGALGTIGALSAYASDGAPAAVLGCLSITVIVYAVCHDCKEIQ